MNKSIHRNDQIFDKTLSRRQFLNAIGTVTAGFILSPYGLAKEIGPDGSMTPNIAPVPVGITQADCYDSTVIKQKVGHLFDAIGGIKDIVAPGMKVAIKINLTGGSGSAYSSKLQGVSITESMWTHPEVLRAVGELLIDNGINGRDIYIIEALWDLASFNNFGYEQVRRNLGAQFINLNNPAPYNQFVDIVVGEQKCYYDSFKVNQIIKDVDVYISIAKMKQHYQAAITHSLKNQIGITPLSLYKQTPNDSNRSRLHYEGGAVTTHLSHAICDLNLACKVHLAVIDGIKNAKGGEGVWNPTFQLSANHVLLAGKDPVATDSIAAYLMGDNPQTEKLPLPDRVRECDNHLHLLHQRGVGTNVLSEIQPVGDGAKLMTHLNSRMNGRKAEDFQLQQNYPNPFNSSTTIAFHLKHSERVTIKLYSITGQQVDCLVDAFFPAGWHSVRYRAPKRLPSGLYIYKMQAGNFWDIKKLQLQK